MSSVDFLAELGSSAEARAVARVLSAAAAPPRPHELRGYESARRAFESAGATPVRHGAGVPFRRLVGVKLAAVAGALTVTGVAVAAEADVLPSPIQRAAHQMLGGVGVPDPDQEARAGQTMASSPGSKTGPGSADSQNPNRASGAPSSSGALLPGTPTGTADSSGPGTPASAADALALCRAYVAHRSGADGDDNSGLSDHDRKRLATLAGGENKIDDFCAQVLAAPPGDPTIPQPTGGTTAPSTAPSVTPDPSHDHKPNTGPSSTPSSDPGSSSSDGNGNGHGHTPNPSHSGHKTTS